MKVFLSNLKKILTYALSSMAVVSVLALIFSLIKKGDVIKTLLNANFIVASIIIVVGILGFMFPISFKSLKKNPLRDHSNIVEILREEKEVKLQDSVFNISWGILHIILAGILEIIIRSVLS
ncbi:hypothetical protein [Alkaliphilus oremlandii]|uniref:DUF3899 domain-containing protein n=1 Tax=Alkaliphilus oremlandii (strain OhILAs) TaxID=350688 RepID=A8MIM3_ALKOO|nr:hypothetical protein [Alkaliphilus oremlandii]ABW19655.1 hypothetical protein Clos_2119 [Alkaliphilus oremlandii OhILAs]